LVTGTATSGGWDAEAANPIDRAHKRLVDLADEHLAQEEHRGGAGNDAHHREEDEHRGDQLAAQSPSARREPARARLGSRRFGGLGIVAGFDDEIRGRAAQLAGLRT
jgi:hypothetical protein